MRRILLSLTTIGLLGTVVIGMSAAYFSDTETSAANVFAAGSIDLKIDNTSYYNGQFWPETSWEADDLDDTHLFFNFTDIKPADWGEDTVSLHVGDNDAWACYQIDITQNDDNGCTEPELADDAICDVADGNNFDGELGDQIQFAFWIDDGDNVLETNEATGSSLLAYGKATDIPAIVTGALADSDENHLGGNIGDPMFATDTYYVGKAWCFGQMALEPIAQDGVGFTLAENGNGPDMRGPGITCDGQLINNAAQTDLLQGDISFRAVQHRHNPNFQCDQTQVGRLLWIIGDEEVGQESNTVDELNFVAFGNFPNPPAIGAPYTRIITQPIDDITDKEFPWNSNFTQNYATDINIEFDYAGPDIPVRLTLGWSPGRSATETKQVWLDGNQLGVDIIVAGADTPGWWSNMPRYQHTRDFNLTSGHHTINLKHLSGDGTLWDFIKLERI